MGAGASGPRASVTFAGTGFTSAPGRTFCSPSTITWSPAFSPSVTSHASPIARSVTSCRRSTFFSVVTTSAVGCPF